MFHKKLTNFFPRDMDKFQIISRMRELELKWKDIAYCLNMTEGSVKMFLKKQTDILELGEKPVVKRTQFETPVVLKVKQLARDNPKLSLRNFGAKLQKEFPEKKYPSLTSIHRILNESGFQMMKLKKKMMIFPRNQLKRLEFCQEMANYGPAFWDTVIWSDETTVRQYPQRQDIEIRIHSSNKMLIEDINPQIHSGGFSVMFWGCFSNWVWGHWSHLKEI